VDEGGKEGGVPEEGEEEVKGVPTQTKRGGRREDQVE